MAIQSIDGTLSLTTTEPCYCCETDVPCQVCSSGPDIGGPWTAVVNGFTDDIPSILTSAQLGMLALAGSPTVHDHIDGVSLSLVYNSGSPTVLRSGSYGFRAVGWIPSDPPTSGEETALAAAWNDAMTGCDTAIYPTWADLRESGFYNLYGTVVEQAGIAVYCPLNGLFDQTGTQLGIDVQYQVTLGITFSSPIFDTSYGWSRTYSKRTYVQLPVAGISCPVDISSNLNTNAVFTTGSLVRDVVWKTHRDWFGTNITEYCRNVASSTDIPFTGTLTLAE